MVFLLLFTLLVGSYFSISFTDSSGCLSSFDETICRMIFLIDFFLRRSAIESFLLVGLDLMFERQLEYYIDDISSSVSDS